MSETRPVVVTGAASGIGRATALALARDGHPVGVTDLDGAGAERVAAAIAADGGTAAAATLDVTDTESVRMALRELAGRLGGVGGIVNNAGWMVPKPLEEHDEEYIRRVLAINVEGPLRVTREALGLLREHGSGRIVNVASDSARTGMSFGAAYTAAKGGVLALTRSLARELAREGITVNTVSPGPVETPLYEESAAAGRRGADLTESLLRTIPLRRLGQPGDVAEVIVFLCSERTGYVTGQTVSVSGGLVIV